MQGLPEKAQKEVVGSAVTMLARSETEQSTSHSVGVLLGRIEGSHSVKITIGKVRDLEETMLTTKTFRKIEVDMDMSRNSLLKLKRILRRDVKIEAGIREVLRTWDKVGVD